MFKKTKHIEQRRKGKDNSRFLFGNNASEKTVLFTLWKTKKKKKKSVNLKFHTQKK